MTPHRYDRQCSCSSCTSTEQYWTDTVRRELAKAKLREAYTLVRGNKGASLK